jgi:hypothetical protein
MAEVELVHEKAEVEECLEVCSSDCEKDFITLKLEVTTISDHKREALTPPLEQVTPVMG